MKQGWDFRNKKERLSSKNSSNYKMTGNEVMWNKNVTKDEQHYQEAFRNKKNSEIQLYIENTDFILL